MKRMRDDGRWLAGLAACLLAVMLPAAAFAQDKESENEQDKPVDRSTCLSAHEKSQVLRLESDLLKARKLLRRCSQGECPSIVRADCTEWLQDVQQAIPSFVVTAQDGDGSDLAEVKVYMDDELLTEELTGRDREANPGLHRFRFEHGDFPDIEKRVVLRQGEKNRVIPVEFRDPSEPSSSQPPFGQPSTGPGGQPLPGEPEADGYRPVPVTTFIFGGVALAAAGSATFFGLRALSERDSAEEDCAPGCPESRADDVRRNTIISDASTGVAVVSATLAVVFYATRPVVPEEGEEPEEVSGWVPPASVSVAPDGSALQVNMRGRF